MESVKKINVNHIMVGERTLDSDRRLKNLKALEKSIKRFGVLQPIVLRFNKNISPQNPYQYILVCGLRRLQAVKNLGQTEIDAIIRYGITDKQALMMEIDDNLFCNDFSIKQREHFFELRSDLLSTPEAA